MLSIDSSDFDAAGDRAEWFSHEYAQSSMRCIALNTGVFAGTAVLANELQSWGFKVISLHPGFVQTDMGRQSSKCMNGIRSPNLNVTESVHDMLKLVNGLEEEDTGKYFLHDGQQMPW